MLLKKAENETAFLSAAIYGFAGSGKSFTAACIAIGLYHHIKAKGPVAYIDTEAGSDFLLPHYAHNGIEVLRSNSRAFTDIIPTMKEAQIAGAEILVIDSCTHLWKELCAAYEEKYHRKDGLQFQDWKNVKGEWGKFMTAVLNEPLHIILLGRAGFDYDYVDIDGKKTLIKTNTKMRAEGETEHEPSITLEMEQVTLSEDDIKTLARKQKQGISTKVTGQFASYMMYVLKDRANFLTGSVFKYPPKPGLMIEPDNPPFADIFPFIEAINIGGKHGGVDDTRNSEEMFAGHDNSYTEQKKTKTIILEELKAELDTHFGMSQADKTARIELLKKHFGTASGTKIENMGLEQLRLGYDKVWTELNPEREENTKAESPSIREGEDNNIPSDAGESSPDYTAVIAKMDKRLKNLKHSALDVGDFIAWSGYDMAKIQGNLNSREWTVAMTRIRDWCKQEMTKAGLGET